jgi:hypothetical protein
MISAGIAGIIGLKSTTVDNAGTIMGKLGVLFTAGYLTNEASGVISTSYIGAVSYLNASTANSGTISGSVAGVALVGGSLLNAASGTIAGGIGVYGGTFSGHGQPATVVNDGSIAGSGTGTAAGGVYLLDGGTVTNHASASISTKNGNGVSIGVGGTVENAGAISGATDAVYFSGTGANRLTVDAGAVFHGNVVANTAGSNILELTATGKGNTATLSGLGSQFTGFQTLLFDTSSFWTVAGSFAGVTTIAGFHPFATLDLTSIGYSTSDTVQLTSSNVLEILDSSNTVLWSVQLESQTFGTPDYSGDTFSIASDNHGGTDVTVLPINQPPVITVPGAQTDTGKSALSISGISITDADDGYSHETFTVVISDSTGLLSAHVRGGGMVSGAGTNTLTLTGTLVEVNAELVTLTYTGTALGGDTINISANDGRGGTDGKTIGVTVDPVSASWIGSSPSGWPNVLNWSDGRAPDDALTDAVINEASSSPYKVKIYTGESFIVHQLTIDSSQASFLLAGSLTSATGVIDTAGTIEMQGGALTGALSLASGTKLFGAGTITGGVANAGLVEARNGLLDITGAITGTGALQVDLKSSLELGGDAANQTIAFDNGLPGNAALARPILILDQPGGSFGTITGMALGDTIDLENTAATSDSYSGGVLTVFDGTTVVATLTIAGSFTGDIFALSSDGKGGTDVTLATSSTGLGGGPVTPDHKVTQLVQTVAGESGALSSFAAASALERMLPGTHLGQLAGVH